VEEAVDTRVNIQVEDDQSQRQTQTYVPPPPPKPKQEEVEEEIFVVVENQPEFPGGNAALMKFLSETSSILSSHRRTVFRDVLFVPLWWKRWQYH